MPPKAFKIRGCTGLGDQIYNYTVCKYYKSKGQNVLIETQYPEVFDPLEIQTTPKRLFDVHVNCSYITRKNIRRTSQFQDVLINAKIDETLSIKIDLDPDVPDDTILNEIAITRQRIDKSNFPICIVSDLYQAKGIRSRSTLMPNRIIYDEILKKINQQYFTILIGNRHDYIKDCDLSFKNIIDVKNLLALVNISDLIYTQVGHLLPMGEALGKKVLSLLSGNYRKSGDPFLNTIMPKKVICGTTGHCLWDDQPDIFNQAEAIIGRVEKVEHETTLAN